MSTAAETEDLAKTKKRVRQPGEDTQLAFYGALLEDDSLQAAYLNITFFTVRWLLYFGFWIWLGRRFFVLSLRQDKDGGSEISA